MQLEVVSDVYREVRDKLLDCKLSLSFIGMHNSLIYRIVSSLIDFLNDLL